MTDVVNQSLLAPGRTFASCPIILPWLFALARESKRCLNNIQEIQQSRATDLPAARHALERFLRGWRDQCSQVAPMLPNSNQRHECSLSFFTTVIQLSQAVKGGCKGSSAISIWLRKVAILTCFWEEHKYILESAAQECTTLTSVQSGVHCC